VGKRKLKTALGFIFRNLWGDSEGSQRMNIYSKMKKIRLKYRFEVGKQAQVKAKERLLLLRAERK